ncbi:MAG: exodeoxyribonuclease VII large subunit [Lewinellaceae bacterium]|nr:exodeoxyribonuclease VII large subunit [Lewinellaceae bacterium]
MEKNSALPLPSVLQRIAVISSEGAAGFQDFREQLANNPFGFAFQCRLFSAAVQGVGLESEMIAAFELIAAQATQFDCVVVLRGGGARLDLAGFDQLELCKKAAMLPLPLFTGIGHDTDETVLDLVAHAALKTPTAVADYLLQHNLFFENEILRFARQISDTALHDLKIKSLELGSLETALQWGVRGCLRSASQHLDALENALPGLLRQRITQSASQLDKAETLCLALHPDAVLRRGFSLSLKDGKVLRSAAEAQPGDLLETRWIDGTKWSKVLPDPEF